jgi:hypothetical protein
MHLLFLGDGERDACVCPSLINRILGATVVPEFKAWKEIKLSRGKGYERKLRFAMAQAREQKLDGVVATIDADNCEGGHGLKRLQTARDEDRQQMPLFPTAVGEAVPHLEAWLLDDPKSVREVLTLSGSKEIPNVRNVDPKSSLNGLCEESERTESFLELLSEFAASHDCERCNHRNETGLQAFVDDVRHELGPLTQA